MEKCTRKDDKRRLERFGELEMLMTNGFGLDFAKKKESGFRSTTPDIGAVL